MENHRLSLQQQGQRLSYHIAAGDREEEEEEEEEEESLVILDGQR
jgi:hypothetical protein